VTEVGTEQQKITPNVYLATLWWGEREGGGVEHRENSSKQPDALRGSCITRRGGKPKPGRKDPYKKQLLLAEQGLGGRLLLQAGGVGCNF